MCGRYSLTRRQNEIVERFGVEQVLGAENMLLPRFNIAPSQMVPVVTIVNGRRVLSPMKWGLIPFWVKDLKTAKPVINARAESVAEKPSFKQSLLQRRCLIPADGFFEWKHQNKSKVPMFIHINEKELFAFAGLWDEWKSPDGEVLRTCTIITTAANQSVASVHDRMPVVVRPDQESTWLDPCVKSAAEILPLLSAVPAESIRMYEVSAGVNSSAEDLPEFVEPVPMQITLPGLF